MEAVLCIIKRLNAPPTKRAPAAAVGAKLPTGRPSGPASMHWNDGPGLGNNRSQGGANNDMTSYRSPGLGGPEPTWKSTLFLALLILTIAGAAVLAFH